MTPRWIASAVALVVLLLAAMVGAAPPSSAAHGKGGAQGARWKSDVIQLSVEPSFERLGDGALDALVLSVGAWQRVRADLPTVIVQRGPEAPLGYDPARANHNTVRFAAEGDPMAKGALAITVITFDTEAGKVLDADIIVNGEHRFDLLDADDTFAVRHSIYDLQNVLTHEFGHLLGLGEEYSDSNATMYAYSLPGETHKRVLSSLDGSNVASLYDDSKPPNDWRPAGELVSVSRRNARESAWVLAVFALVVAAWSGRRRAFRSAAAFAFVGAALVLPSVVSGRLHRRVAASIPAATVVDSVAQWREGLIVTRLHLVPADCSGAASKCAERSSVDVLGGSVGNIRQVVGRALPPPVGARVSVERPRPGAQVELETYATAEDGSLVSISVAESG